MGVWLELTLVPPLGTTIVLGPEVFGATVVLAPAVFGATVVLGPDVSGATVVLGPVKKLGELVGFCALADPLGAMVTPFGLGAMVVLLVVAARCCCCCARQAGRWVAVSIMQLVPAGKAAFCAWAAVTAPAAPARMAPISAARRIE